MKKGQIRKDQIEPFIAAIESSDFQVIAASLDSKVPGIAASVSDELEQIKQAIQQQDYGFSIQSRVSDLRRRLDYASKGLYSRCEGTAWHYA